MHRFSLAVVALLLASPAWAHAYLKSAIPAAGGSVHAPPMEVVVTFTEGVEPRFSTLVVQDAAGGAVTAGPVHRAGSEIQLAVPLKPVGPGTYKVIWHALSLDGHKTGGTYAFTVTQ